MKGRKVEGRRWMDGEVKKEVKEKLRKKEWEEWEGWKERWREERERVGRHGAREA